MASRAKSRAQRTAGSDGRDRTPGRKHTVRGRAKGGGAGATAGKGDTRTAATPGREATGYANLQGVGRAMAMLELLADRPMKAKELTETLGIKWTTAYRTLAYLRDNGYLARDDSTGVYYIGSRLYYIGSSYVNHLPILQGSGPYLKAAAEETGATVQLVERDRYRSVALLVLEPTEGEYIPKTTIGYHFPLHCGAKGQVLLAYAEPDLIEEYLSRPLHALTPHTTTDPDQLRERLQEIRDSGYAVTRRDVQLSTAAVACPVHNSSANVVASVTMIANYAGFDEIQEKLVDAASRTAQAISMLMGWRPEVAAR
jgi:DNA-binding IclR family transcriptional regulator